MIPRRPELEAYLEYEEANTRGVITEGTIARVTDRSKDQLTDGRSQARVRTRSADKGSAIEEQLPQNIQADTLTTQETATRTREAAQILITRIGEETIRQLRAGIRSIITCATSISETKIRKAGLNEAKISQEITDALREFSSTLQDVVKRTTVREGKVWIEIDQNSQT